MSSLVDRVGATVQGTLTLRMRAEAKAWAWRVRLLPRRAATLRPAQVEVRALSARTLPRIVCERRLTPRLVQSRITCERVPLPLGAPVADPTAPLLRRVARGVWARLSGVAAVWMVARGTMTRLWWRDVVEPKQPSEGK
jgi:hypothetical protein